MITTADIIRPAHINLEVKAASDEEAVFQVASLLKEDERVADWNQFYSNLTSRDSSLASGMDFEIRIPHARTGAVKGMVMSIGRYMSVASPELAKGKVHYIFVIGVPAALAGDYLRVIGAIARVLKDHKTEQQLRIATEPAEFLAILSSGEMSL